MKTFKETSHQPQIGKLYIAKDSIAMFHKHPHCGAILSNMFTFPKGENVLLVETEKSCKLFSHDKTSYNIYTFLKDDRKVYFILNSATFSFEDFWKLRKF